jgi:NAD(P)-dependent dehydrogenase (short-subunit alcohol dehydrogenase family)
MISACVKSVNIPHENPVSKTIGAFSLTIFQFGAECQVEVQHEPRFLMPMSSVNFHPSAVVITGVTHGLGRAMVDEFVRLGHIVSGCARTKDEIQQLSRTYPSHDFQTVDVSLDSEVRAWAERVLSKHGPPDFVLNNAAVINLKAPLWEVGDQEFSYEIDINIKGVANVIRHFAPSMVSRKRGVIVNFSSRWGKKCEKQMAPYCATKWAVLALTKVLAEELRAEGVAAVAINPGIVRTRMLQRYLGDNASLETTAYLTPAAWAEFAVPQILRLRLKHTGTFRNMLTKDNIARAVSLKK